MKDITFIRSVLKIGLNRVIIDVHIVEHQLLHLVHMGMKIIVQWKVMGMHNKEGGEYIFINI